MSKLRCYCCIKFLLDETTICRLLSTTLSTWWRHQMEAFSRLLVLCAGNSPVTGEFPSQRPVTFSAWLALCEGNPLVIGVAKLWYFLWCTPEQTAEQTVEMLMIWDTLALIVTSRLWSKQIGLYCVFTRGQFWPSGIVVACVCLCVCPCACVNPQLVRAITHHPFKRGSPNLDHMCKRPWLRSLLFWGVIDLDLQGQI